MAMEMTAAKVEAAVAEVAAVLETGAAEDSTGTCWQLLLKTPG